MKCRFLTLASVVATIDAAAFDSTDYKKTARDRTTSGPSWPVLGAEKSTYSYIHVDSPLRQVPYYFGTNVPLYLSNSFMADDDTLTKLETAGTNFLRYPGGSAANKWLYDGDYDTYPYFSSWSWMTGSAKYSLENFVETVNATGAIPLLELNAAFALVYGNDNATDYFISMHEALLAYGCNVTYYEFGNENYGSWEPPYGDYDVNGTLYGEALVAIAQGMKAAYPHIQIGAVGQYTDSDVEGDDDAKFFGSAAKQVSRSSVPGFSTPVAGTVIASWMRDLLSVDGATDQIDFIVIHEYFYKTSGTAPSNNDLLNEVDWLSDMRVGVSDIYACYVPSATVPPIIVSEFNLVQLASGGCGALSQFVNVLWHADFLGSAISSGDVAALMGFAWADSAESCDSTGRGDVGDYGLVSMGRSEIDGVEDGTVTPQFFAYSLFNLAFGDTAVNATVASGGSSKLKVFASTFDGGEVGIVIINADSEAHTFRLDGLTKSGSVAANGWVLASSDPDSSDPLSETGVNWNNVTDPSDFPLDDNYDAYMASAKYGEELSVDVPAYATAGLIVYQTSGQESHEDGSVILAVA